MIKYFSTDEIKQGTPEWHKIREGLLTGTDAYDILDGKSYQEIISKKVNNNFTGNYYTRRGRILEDEAREIYSEVYSKVQEFGFIKNDKYPLCGYSPDGIITQEKNNIGLWECKAFNKERHPKVYKSLDAHVLAQIQFGLMMTELPWCDLTLYNPDMENIEDTFLIKRIYPMREVIDHLIEALGEMFLELQKSS